MNYIRRAAGTVGGVASSAASYLPVVGSYFSETPAANNTTRRNNSSTTAPATVPVTRVNIPTMNVTTTAPTPIATSGGGSVASEGTLARIRREREEREVAAKAAANANKAAKRTAFFAQNNRRLPQYANSSSRGAAETLKTLQSLTPYTPGHQGAAAAYTPPANAASRAALFKKERIGKNTTVVTGIGAGKTRKQRRRRS
jgi:hypothetical protein